MPEDEKPKSALCPICDSPVELDATKCPECKADLTLFGVKTGDEESSDVDIPEDDESIAKLLGEIGKKDSEKESELFEEIMAAVDKSGVLPDEGEASEIAVEDETTGAVEEPTEGAAEAPAEGAVMFECPLCNTLVSEDASSCPGCGAIFAEPEEGAAEAQGEQDEPVQEEVASEPAETEVDGEAEQPQVAYEESPVVEEVEREAVEGTYYEPAAEEPREEAHSEPAVEEQPVYAEPEPEPAYEEPEKKKRFKLGKKKKERPAAEAAPAARARPGVSKDEKALHRELTSCVSEVKPLLAMARKFEINVFEGRKLIDQAISAGKKRDFEKAITLVRESKETIEGVINEHITDSVQSTVVKINALSKAGGDVRNLEGMINTVHSYLGGGDFTGAIELARKTAEEADKSVMRLKSDLKRREHSEKGKDVAEKLKDLVDLIKTGEQVKVNVKGAKSLLTQARMAIKKNELDSADELLVNAKEDFLKELPKQLADIISSSKPVLYKAKMQGVDIRPSIKLLREASTSLKLNNYLDALEAIKQYKVEMSQYLG